jgi:hypothetical protein
MVELLRLLCGALIGLFQSSARREAEILHAQHITPHPNDPLYDCFETPKR